MKIAESYPDEYETPREKEKLLVLNNLSFSYSVSNRLALQTRKNQGLFGKGLNQIFDIYLSLQMLSIWTSQKYFRLGKLKAP